VDGERLVEAAVWIRDVFAVPEREFHAAASQQAGVPRAGNPDHDIRVVDTGQETVGDGVRGGGESPSMTEADLQDLIARLQIEQLERNAVCRCGLMRHDPGHYLAQQAGWSSALASDEFRAAHVTSPYADGPP